MSTLFIGMPVYNGEKYIGRALESLINQVFSDWTLVISDNASQDNTASICEVYCKKDSRIRYFRQETNIGPVDNFKYLLELSDAPFFMWAAADDEWDEYFEEACITGMTQNNADWAFTNIVNIDSLGRIIRRYESFKKFAKEDINLSIINFLLSPEALGKANLIYSIYRTSNLKETMLSLLSSPFKEIIGFDMVFNFGVLCRAKLFIDDRVLFRKRHTRNTDLESNVEEIEVDKPYIRGSFDLDRFKLFKEALIFVSKETNYVGLVHSVMEYRLQLQEEIEELNNEMIFEIENAKGSIARWSWLKKLLKTIHFL